MRVAAEQLAAQLHPDLCSAPDAVERFTTLTAEYERLRSECRDSQSREALTESWARLGGLAALVAMGVSNPVLSAVLLVGAGSIATQPQGPGGVTPLEQIAFPLQRLAPALSEAEKDARSAAAAVAVSAANASTLAAAAAAAAAEATSAASEAAVLARLAAARLAEAESLVASLDEEARARRAVEADTRLAAAAAVEEVTRLAVTVAGDEQAAEQLSSGDVGGGSGRSRLSQKRRRKKAVSRARAKAAVTAQKLGEARAHADCVAAAAQAAETAASVAATAAESARLDATCVGGEASALGRAADDAERLAQEARAVAEQAAAAAAALKVAGAEHRRVQLRRDAALLASAAKQVGPKAGGVLVSDANKVAGAAFGVVRSVAQAAQKVRRRQRPRKEAKQRQTHSSNE